MLEHIKWIIGIVILAGCCYVNYPFRKVAHRNYSAFSSNPLVYSRPVTYLGTPNTSSVEYPPSSTHIPNTHRDYRD